MTFCGTELGRDFRLGRKRAGFGRAVRNETAMTQAGHWPPRPDLECQAPQTGHCICGLIGKHSSSIHAVLLKRTEETKAQAPRFQLVCRLSDAHLRMSSNAQIRCNDCPSELFVLFVSFCAVLPGLGSRSVAARSPARGLQMDPSNPTLVIRSGRLWEIARIYPRSLRRRARVGEKYQYR